LDPLFQLDASRQRQQGTFVHANHSSPIAV
jgi:hypothetical protein